MASIVSRRSRWSFTLAAASTAPKGPPSPSTSTLSLEPFFPRSVGFLPTFFPPEPGFAQPAVRALPLPIDGPEFVAFGRQLGPDALQDAARAPALEPVMDGALGAELARQVLPLAARAHPEENAVERPAPVGVVPAGGLGRPELLEDGHDTLPERIGHFPDGPQRLALAGLLLELLSSCSHGSALRSETSFLLTCANSMPWRRFSDSFLSSPRVQFHDLFPREPCAVPKSLAVGAPAPSQPFGRVALPSLPP